MGYFPGRYITEAAHFLLGELLKRPVIRYSELYDGTDETHDQIALGCGIAPNDEGYYSAELAIDLAVREMEEAGLVETEELEQGLVDGEWDYRIRVTRKGIAFARSGRRHHSPGRVL